MGHGFAGQFPIATSRIHKAEPLRTRAPAARGMNGRGVKGPWDCSTSAGWGVDAMHQHGLRSFCGGLFGCGEDSGRRYMVESDAVDASLTPRVKDRLHRMDELDQQGLEPYLASSRVSRRRLVRLGGWL